MASVSVTVHPLSYTLILLGWGLPFFWALVWGILTVPYVKWAMARETEAWENDQILDPEKKLAEPESAPPSETEQTNGALDPTSSRKTGERELSPDVSPESSAEAKKEHASAPEAQESAPSTKEEPSSKPPEA